MNCCSWLISGSVGEHVEPVAGVGSTRHRSRLHSTHTPDTRADRAVDQTACHGHRYVSSAQRRLTRHPDPPASLQYLVIYLIKSTGIIIHRLLRISKSLLWLHVLLLDPKPPPSLIFLPKPSSSHIFSA